MKNLRLLTPTLAMVIIALLGFVVVELRGAKSYADSAVQSHERHPHIMTGKRLTNLDVGIGKLTVEIQSLRREIMLLNKGGFYNGNHRNSRTDNSHNPVSD